MIVGVPVAESAMDLLCDGDPTLVRKCENPACVLYFYDATKNRRGASSIEYVIRCSDSLYTTNVSRKLPLSRRFAPRVPLLSPTFSHRMMTDGAHEKSWKSAIRFHTVSTGVLTTIEF